MERPRELRRKPLVEAILEVHWDLQKGPEPGAERDPNYKFLLGSLRSRVQPNYPYHEELPAALIPEEMTPHIVHHRFRSAPGGWPLLQVGPGIFTVNDTANYTWESFQRTINDAIPALMDSYATPGSQSLRFKMLMLRFINAVPLDPTKTNVLDFLRGKMGTTFALPSSIFETRNVADSPVEFASQAVFPCKDPQGVMLFKFGTGVSKGAPALVFELWFRSEGAHVPEMPSGFSKWASAAHAVVESCFFQLTEGELLKEFNGGP